MSDPEKIQVTRYRCPHCRKSWSAKRATLEHMGRCWLDPQNRSCRTCDHFRPGYGGTDSGWNEGWHQKEHCAVGIELHPVPDDDVLDSDVTVEPEKGLPLHCPSWTAES